MFNALKDRNISRKLGRRSLLFSAAYSIVLSTSLLGCGSNAPVSNSNTNSTTNTSKPADTKTTEASKTTPSGSKKVIRIIRSRGLGGLAVLEKKGTLAKELEKIGYEVKWLEFAAGPQQLEAVLNANGLDIASTAAHPPVFAQAAGGPLVYLAASPTNGKGVSLLVPKDSPAKTIADLKGKKVAFQKASIGHYLAVRAFEDAGLTINDFESVFLPPADAVTALTQGKVDAWYIWEPFVTRAEIAGIGRVLTDGEKLQDVPNYVSTNRKFYEENKEAIKVLFEELEKADAWVGANPKQAAELLTDVAKIEVPILEKVHTKYEYGLRPITEETIKSQERVAEFWFKFKLIPNKPNVREGFLKPEEYEYLLPKNVLALAKEKKS